MPAVFGANTGDDFKTDSTLSWSTVQAHLVFGWFYPTTLTAGKGYWGCTSASTHAEVAPATDEMRFVFQRATTDAVWDSSDADITVDNWWWIGMFTRTSGTVWMLPPYVWIGTPTTPPVLKTVASSTAGSGAASNSATALGFGNTGPSDANAFEGDIGHVGQIHHYNETDPLVNIFQVPSISSSALTAAEELFIYQRFVVPIWQGDIGRFQSGKMRQNIQDSAVSPCHLGDFVTLDAGGAVVDVRNFAPRRADGNPVGNGTLSGATNSTTNLKSPRTVLNPASIGHTASRSGSRMGARRSVWVR